MDSHNFIDTVKLEKANAIARYRRFRNLAKLLQVFEVIVAVTLLSWSSTCLPAVLKLYGQYLLESSLYVLNPHVIFLIGNAIVIALFVLSRHIDAGNNSGASDFYDYYVEKRENQNSMAAAESQPSPEPVKEETIGGEEKQIVCKENAARQTECEAVAKAIDKATKQIQKFERTKSEKLKRDISVKPRKELRRSETEVRQIVVTSGNRRTTAYETVDNLSNEEFRLTVEAFIEKQLKFLRQQKMAEIEY